MKVKGLPDKLERLNPNSVTFSMSELGMLKEGKIVDLKKEHAESLIKQGMVKKIKDSKKGEKLWLIQE